MSARRPIVEALGIVNRFGSQLVHDHLDMEVRENEVFGIVGGSGTGKSVLMRSIIGLQTPNAGEVTVFGEQMLGRDEADAQVMARAWRYVAYRDAPPSGPLLVVTVERWSGWASTA